MVEEIAINDIKNVDVQPFTSIASKKGLNDSLRVMVGAQNFYPEKSGAYTGEISAIMLREIGVTHVIVGHSERRAYFSEANDFINKKVIAAIPILLCRYYVSVRQSSLYLFSPRKLIAAK